MEHDAKSTKIPTMLTSESDGENVVMTIETQSVPHQLVWRGSVDPETALRIGHSILATAYGIIAARR